jgi:hypothetical protein
MVAATNCERVGIKRETVGRYLRLPKPAIPIAGFKQAKKQDGLSKTYLLDLRFRLARFERVFGNLPCYVIIRSTSRAGASAIWQVEPPSNLRFKRPTIVCDYHSKTRAF